MISDSLHCAYLICFRFQIDVFDPVDHMVSIDVTIESAEEIKDFVAKLEADLRDKQDDITLNLYKTKPVYEANMTGNRTQSRLIYLVVMLYLSNSVFQLMQTLRTMITRYTNACISLFDQGLFTLWCDKV